MWRVLHEFLWAKSVLNQRHMEPTAFWDVCGVEKESIRHILIECTTARLFWRGIQSITGAKLPRLHTHTWASDLLMADLCSEKERGLFIIGMYSLWMQRNKRRHGETQGSLRIAVQWAVDLAHDLWQIIQSKK